MTISTPPFWGPDYDFQYEPVVIEYDFATGRPWGTYAATGSGSIGAVDFTDANGAALKLDVGANPGTALFTGIAVSPAVVKAVGIEVFGIDFAGAGHPVLTVGLEDVAGTRLSELYRDDNGFELLVANGAAVTSTIIADGNDLAVIDADMGMIADFTTGITTAHVGSSVSNITTVMPSGTNLNVIARAVTTGSGSYNTYTVYIRKIRVTVYR